MVPKRFVSIDALSGMYARIEVITQSIVPTSGDDLSQNSRAFYAIARYIHLLGMLILLAIQFDEWITVGGKPVWNEASFDYVQTDGTRSLENKLP